jgi:hypothetical protein
VGVEKVDIHKNGVILGDRKCLCDPRKSFVGHPDATQFGTSSSRRVFQQPRDLSPIEICGGNYLPISRPEETGTNVSLVVSIGLEC